MIDHKAAILNDFDSCFGERFSRGGVANPRLQPNSLRHLPQNIVNVRWNVPRSSEHVDEINIDRNVDEPSKNGFAEYLRY